MSATRTIYCGNPLCDRYQAPIVSISHPDAEFECEGIIKLPAGTVACGGALLTDGQWDEVSERVSERMLTDYHAGDAPQSTYDNAARRK